MKSINLKPLAYIFMFVGCVLSIVFMLRMFMVFEDIITQDAQLFGLLFLAMFIMMLGLFILEAVKVPQNEYESRNRNQQMWNSGIPTVLCFALFILTFFI
jgi:hypothetical protein